MLWCGWLFFVFACLFVFHGEGTQQDREMVCYDALRKGSLILIPELTLGIVVLPLYFWISACLPEMYTTPYWDLKGLFLFYI